MNLKTVLSFVAVLLILLVAFASHASDRLSGLVQPPEAKAVHPTPIAALARAPRPSQDSAPAPEQTLVSPEKETGADPHSRPKNRAVIRVPVYTSFDFLSGYLSNRTYPILVEGKPWINASTNIAQYNDELGGTTFWDFWGDAEQWETTNHMWQDDQGTWQVYKIESVRTEDGRYVPAYVLVDRQGPGAMDLLWFTHDTIIWSGDILQHLKILGTRGVEEQAKWGNLSRLGNLRLQVDDRIVFDGPIEDWFSGQAQGLTPDMAAIFVWHYQQFGSTGNMIPVPYQKQIKVSVYGGQDKPKWFMATGITLPPGTLVRAYTNDLPRDEMARLARNVLEPENYIYQFGSQTTRELRVTKDSPAVLQFDGSGTVQGIQFRIPNNHDLASLWLQVKYGDEIGIDLPFIAFFGEPDHLSLHHSAPIGTVEASNAYLFYSNFPMPYQNGMTVHISSRSSTPVPISARWATADETFNTQLRVLFNPGDRLQALAPDYQVRLAGDGKLVGLVLVTKDQEYRAAQHRFLPGTFTEDPATHIWPMGYLEANLKMMDGAGNSRLYSGQEDWAGGGYYFNLGYTTPGGGGNRPFGGILRYKDGEEGYATLFRYFNDLSAFRFKNGLLLSFGHGTWKNNYPVSYGTTLYYYKDVGGMQVIPLPASEYVMGVQADIPP